MSAINNSNFIKINDSVFNINYIKKIDCNVFGCYVTIANTNGGKSEYDRQIRCDNKECENKLKEIIDKL